MALWAYNSYAVVLVFASSLEISASCKFSYSSWDHIVTTIITQILALYSMDQMLVSIDSENNPLKYIQHV